jgi:hypothetical protein
VDTLVCLACGASPPLREGVALLVRDPPAHEAALEAARRASPGWYEMEQPRADASPWRHHLAKRRRYVEGVLRRALAEHAAQGGQTMLAAGE